MPRERALGTLQSNRAVQNACETLSTETNSANCPKSAGLYKRVRSGAASTGRA